MEETEDLKPTVVLAQKRFWQTKKGLAALTLPLALILFAILMIALNYFDVIFLPLYSLPKKLLITCPIQDCSKNNPVSFNDKVAAGYNVASKSAVLNPIKIVDTKQFILPPFTKEDPIGLHQSFIWGDSCYTITYTVPPDANISQITKLPLNSGSQIISLGVQSIKISNQSLNLILQIQKRPLEKGKTDQEKCPVYSLDPAKIGPYQQITTDLFKK